MRSERSFHTTSISSRLARECAAGYMAWSADAIHFIADDGVHVSGVANHTESDVIEGGI